MKQIKKNWDEKVVQSLIEKNLINYDDGELFIEEVFSENILFDDNKIKNASFDHVYDATGKSIIPGLVDGHTHPVWAGDRVHEFAMKLAGASYMDIHAKGGGIHFTVRHTTEASEESLLSSLRERLEKAIGHGTTLIEAKSGS